jgi:predicted RecB family nuclease
VRKYVEKYGDPDGTAARVLESLYDLHPVVEGSLVIPVPSYGLKLIERAAGYERRMPEAGGKWSMATYIEAVETEDPGKAAELIGEIVRYNEEDLDALWAVYRWLRSME